MCYWSGFFFYLRIFLLLEDMSFLDNRLTSFYLRRHLTACSSAVAKLVRIQNVKKKKRYHIPDSCCTKPIWDSFFSYPLRMLFIVRGLCWRGEEWLQMQVFILEGSGSLSNMRSHHWARGKGTQRLEKSIIENKK